MGAIFKVLNSFLGVLAIITCLAAVCIIIYSIVRPDLSRFGIGNVAAAAEESQETEADAGDGDQETAGQEEESLLASTDHRHEYKEEVYDEAKCLENGRSMFVCDCGDYYYEDINALGHQSSEWQVVASPTATLEGEQVKTCLVCGEVVASEWLPPLGEPASPAPSPSPHIHSYIASVFSEPTCTVAGIRRFTCSCGSYYQEMINANGHMPADWLVTVEATASRVGSRQRICNVCHSMVDIQQIPRLQTASPAASGSPSGSAAPGATPGGSPAASQAPAGSAGQSPSPSAAHTHSFTYYTFKEPTCTQEGIETGNCSNAGCGAEDIKPIPINKDAHNFNSSGICTRCGFNRNPSPSPSSSPAN